MIISHEKYYNHKELSDILSGLGTMFPGLVDIQIIGKSVEEREIWAVTLTDKSTGKHYEKPALIMDACVHAGEVTGTQVCLYFLDYVLSNYENNKEIKRMLEKRTVYIIPRINPDGAERFIMTDFESWGNMNQFPPKENWSGLERCDIDSNGMQLLMRIEDETGEWKISQLDNRLMIPREPYEYGDKYFRIYPEGMIVGEHQSVDDFRVLPREYQLNMNRNYADGWTIRTGINEGGKYPFSEPEVKAIANFIMEHKNIGIGNDFHTYGGVLLRPYSHQGDSNFPEIDLHLFDVIGEVGKKWTGYDLVSAYDGFTVGVSEPRRGCIDDWAYECCGFLMISTELWNMAEEAGVHREEGNYYPFQSKTEEEEIKMLKWNDYKLGKSGFIDWKEFNHPQFGKVEIGGWNWKYTSKNPPLKFLEKECEKNAIHCIKQTGLLPELVIKSVKTEKIEVDIYQIEVVVENHGYFPTNITQKGVLNKLVKPVTATIDNYIEIISGNKNIDLGHILGRHRRDKNFYFGDPTEGVPRKTATAKWIIRADKEEELEINILSERAGILSLKIKMQDTI